jgi:ribosomal protein S18 acetylase RimI-like enzyme
MPLFEGEGLLLEFLVLGSWFGRSGMVEWGGGPAQLDPSGLTIKVAKGTFRRRAMSQLTPLIRRAVPGDESILAALGKAVHELHVAARPDIFLPYDAETLRTWFGELLAADEVKVWIVEVDCVAAGYVSAARKSREANPFSPAREWCEIDNLSVDPAFQKQGLGRLLMETAMADARSAGLHAFELTTWWFNEAGRAAFQSLGFQPRFVRFEHLDP